MGLPGLSGQGADHGRWLHPEATRDPGGIRLGRISPRPQFWGPGAGRDDTDCRARPQTQVGLCLEGSLVSSPGVGGLLASLGLQDVKAPLCFHNHRHVGFGDRGAHQAQPSIYRRGADPKVPLGREPLPGGGRGFDAEGKGGLQGSPEGQAAPGMGVRPTRHPAPSTRGPLTDVGVLQEAADPSLSLQLLVIWGQKKPGVASSPAARHPMPRATQATGCRRGQHPRLAAWGPGPPGTAPTWGRGVCLQDPQES